MPIRLDCNTCILLWPKQDQPDCFRQPCLMWWLHATEQHFTPVTFMIAEYLITRNCTQTDSQHANNYTSCWMPVFLLSIRMFLVRNWTDMLSTRWWYVSLSPLSVLLKFILLKDDGTWFQVTLGLLLPILPSLEIEAQSSIYHAIVMPYANIWTKFSKKAALYWHHSFKTKRW